MSVLTVKSKLDQNSNNSNSLNKPSFSSQSNITNINKFGNPSLTASKLLNDSYPINHNIRYFCPKCMIYPNINFIDENQIEFTCKCENRQNLNLFIEEIFDKTKEYLLFENKQKAEIANEKTKIQNQELTCKCSGDNKFKFYCNFCDKNLCEYCCDEHFHGKNEMNNKLIVFDFFNKKIMEKIEEILAIIIWRIRIRRRTSDRDPAAFGRGRRCGSAHRSAAPDGGAAGSDDGRRRPLCVTSRSPTDGTPSCCNRNRNSSGSPCSSENGRSWLPGRRSWTSRGSSTRRISPPDGCRRRIWRA